MSRRKERPPCTAGCGKRVALPTRTYCSVRCQRAEQRRRLIERFLSGGYPAFSYTGRSFVRAYLIERHGERCMRCGWCERNPATGRVPLELEHVDGDWRNARPENLLLLCPNCHALTPTFKALNKGRGREPRTLARRARAREGAALTEATRTPGLLP